ncbi:MAG: AdeC/AdeK/OprM family multidrug efflux complex outer membrane factor [Desulfuromonadaceae bacterium]
MLRTKLMSKSILALCLLLAGCTLAPPYERPAAPIAADWPAASVPQAEGAASEPAAAELPWRSFFLDPQLQTILATALEHNRDLRVAVLNIERARAQYRIEGAALFPHIDANADGRGQRLPKDLSGTGAPETVHQYGVSLGFSAYELDLFGRIRSLKEQALEQFLASEQARRSVQISLVSEVAISYLSLAADRERLQLARQTLANQQAAYNLVQSRTEAGIASALDLNQARTSVEAARVEIARLTTLVARDRNALSLLAGTPLADEGLPTALAAESSALQALTPGLPSGVLLSRPDILAAEHLLQAANANIGAARAAFFPRIALTGSIGSGSNELSGLFEAGSRSWLFVPQISLPIFNAGSNRARLQVAQVDRDIAVARYEQAIQTAFREVADALAQGGTIEEQLAAQQALTAAYAESYRLSQARFEQGVDSYLNVLDAQRALYRAQQNLIDTRLTRLANRVTLYRVLGGGSR